MAPILAGDGDRCELMRIRGEDREGHTGGRRAEGRWMEIVGGEGGKKRGAEQGGSVIINRRGNRFKERIRRAARNVMNS